MLLKKLFKEEVTRAKHLIVNVVGEATGTAPKIGEITLQQALDVVPEDKHEAIKEAFDVLARAVPIGVEAKTAPKVQSFSPNIIEKGVIEGWLKVKDGTIILGSGDKEVIYRIKKTPGAYCCHCGKLLPTGNKIAQAHVMQEHKGQQSPDRNNPAGYEVFHGYRCEKEEN